MTLLHTAAITVAIAPLLTGLAGAWRRRDSLPDPAPIPWRNCALSTLAFTLAFNLQFFIQEICLVVPKALTPGLQPTLYHNDHAWAGSHPLAELFQGTGALGTLITGLLCAAFVARARSRASRLWLIWMGYCGVLMALPQVVLAAVSTQGDVGRALVYLQLPPATKFVAAGVALLLMPLWSWWLLRRLPGIEGARPGTLSPGRAFWLATLPALLSLALILPFRVPREFVEVVIVPLAVVLVGIPWMQALAAWSSPASIAPPARPGSLAGLLAAVLGLLAFFQLVLRPGVEFF